MKTTVELEPYEEYTVKGIGGKNITLPVFSNSDLHITANILKDPDKGLNLEFKKGIDEQGNIWVSFESKD